MGNINLLDCTLRDGGYITKWIFKDETIKNIISLLQQSGLEFIETGYLNKEGKENNSSQFCTIEQIKRYLPKNKKSIMLAMVDVEQFEPEDITKCDGNSIDGIRVVFYKHQIEKAFKLADKIKESGYKLFMQPMVTIDYSVYEYENLINRISKLIPFGVSIVDSFGYMTKKDFRNYFNILDCNLPECTMIGFHSHNNLQLAFITAQDALEYETDRSIIIDVSLLGIGRGAGNLNTELMANHCNVVLKKNYDISIIMRLLDTCIMPIRREKEWGYSPYLFMTSLYRCHPNYACFLLEEYPNVSIEKFEAYIKKIPKEMKTRCTKNYALEIWKKVKK